MDHACFICQAEIEEQHGLCDRCHREQSRLCQLHLEQLSDAEIAARVRGALDDPKVLAARCAIVGQHIVDGHKLDLTERDGELVLTAADHFAFEWVHSRHYAGRCEQLEAKVAQMEAAAVKTQLLIGRGELFGQVVTELAGLLDAGEVDMAKLVLAAYGVEDAPEP